MKRRDAIKNLGLAVGYATVIPSAFSILQSCTTEENKWTPLFFTNDEGIVITNLIDLILPKTEKTPGALEVNVPEFIDLFAHKGMLPEALEDYKIGIRSIMEELPIPETGAKDLPIEEYDRLLSKYLRANKAERKQYEKDKDILYVALANLRAQSVWAFKTSREVGENILAYDPIPGEQKGCIPVSQATGGKAWSL